MNYEVICYDSRTCCPMLGAVKASFARDVWFYIRGKLWERSIVSCVKWQMFDRFKAMTVLQALARFSGVKLA